MCRDSGRPSRPASTSRGCVGIRDVRRVLLARSQIWDLGHTPHDLRNVIPSGGVVFAACSVWVWWHTIHLTLDATRGCYTIVAASSSRENTVSIRATVGFTL